MNRSWQIDIDRVVLTGGGGDLDPAQVHELVAAAVADGLARAELPRRRTVLAEVSVDVGRIGSDPAAVASAIGSGVGRAVAGSTPRAGRHE